MAQVDVPLCVDCKHCEFHSADAFRTGTGSVIHRCIAMTGMMNPIDGQPIVSADCGMMRLGCDCGREGKLFEPKGERQ